MTLDLGDKHAVVTGGGSGIGQAIALALASAGAKVSLAGRTLSKLEAAAGALGPQRGCCVTMDVRDKDSVRAAASAIETEYGPADILVNNAGAALSAPFLRTSPEQWNEMIAVNLTGAFLVSQCFLPRMVERQWGRVVNIASTAAHKPYPYVSAYVAAKHGLLGLTRSLALEFAACGITVNAVCPGFTETPLLARSVEKIVGKTGRGAATVRTELARSNPMGRIIEPHEVARVVVWLAGPNSGSITGQAIAVAGGEVMAG